MRTGHYRSRNLPPPHENKTCCSSEQATLLAEQDGPTVVAEQFVTLFAGERVTLLARTAPLPTLAALFRVCAFPTGARFIAAFTLPPPHGQPVALDAREDVEAIRVSLEVGDIFSLQLAPLEAQHLQLGPRPEECEEEALAAQRRADNLRTPQDVHRFELRMVAEVAERVGRDPGQALQVENLELAARQRQTALDRRVVDAAHVSNIDAAKEARGATHEATPLLAHGHEAVELREA